MNVLSLEERPPSGKEVLLGIHGLKGVRIGAKAEKVIYDRQRIGFTLAGVPTGVGQIRKR